MQTADSQSPFSGTLDRPTTGDSNGTPSPRLGNTRLANAVYEDSQIVKALFVALRTAVPHDTRIELLHSCGDELKFLIAAQPRVSAFSHRRRHSLRHPALAMATKRFYFRRRERQAAYEQYLQEQQQQQLQEQQEQRATSSSPQPDGLDMNELGSPWLSRGSVDLSNSTSLASKRALSSAATSQAPSRSGAGRRQGRKGGTKNKAPPSMSPTPATARSASVSFADYTGGGGGGGGGHDGPLSTSAMPSSFGHAHRPTSTSQRGFSDGNDWCDFSMSVSNALWSYRRPSQASSSRLPGGGGGGGGADWGLNGSHSLSSAMGTSASAAGSGPRRRQSLASAGSFQSAHSVFGVFGNSGPALRVLEADRYRGMQRTNSFGFLGGRTGAELELRTSVRSLLAGGDVVRGLYTARTSMTDTSDDDELLRSRRSSLGTSLNPLGGGGGGGGGGGRRGRLSRTGSRSSLAPPPGASAATGFDTVEEQEYQLYQQLEDTRWEQIGLCYDLLLRTATSLTTKASLAAAGDALVNDAIRRFWERVTISPAAEDTHRQARAKSGQSAASHGADAEAGATATAGATVASKGTKGTDAGRASPATTTTTTTTTIATTAGTTTAAEKRRAKAAAASAESDKKKKKTPKKPTTVAGAASRSAKASGHRTPTTTPTTPSPVAASTATAAADGDDGLTAERMPSAKDGLDGDAGVHLSSAEAGANDLGVIHIAAPGGAKSKKKKKKIVTSSNLPNVAAYMTPMQYIYLNMRIAQVLLPQRKELEVEMLESVQEDLIIDAAYEPRAAGSGRTTSVSLARATSLNAGSGSENSSRSPSRERSPSDGHSLNPSSHTNNHSGSARRRSERGAGPASAFGPPPQWLLSRGEPLLLSGRAFARDRGGVLADHQARLARQRRRSAEDGDDSQSDAGVDGFDGDDGTSSAAGGTVAPWSADRLPSIHYAQFWLSMLELADNWTCTAGNPVDMYIFLMELYGEVFGHDWDDEDEQLVKAMRTASTAPRNAAREAALAQNMQDALQSFHDLVKELDDLTSSSSADESSRLGGSDRRAGFDGSESDDDDDDEDPFLRKKRLRHAKRRAKRRHRDDEASDSDSNDGDGPRRPGKGSGGRRGSDEDEDDEEGSENDWRYVQRVDKDGRLRYYRRRVQYDKSRRRLQREAEAKARGDDPDDLSDHDSDLSVYMIEEELNRQKRVLHRRRARCHLSADALKRVQARRRRQARRKGEGDAFMYEPDGPNSVFKRRKYFDERPRKKRKLEYGRWADDYDMEENLSAATSWSSFEDEGDGEHAAGARRRRTRHCGTRREKRRYRRPAGFYYDEEDTDEEDDEEDDFLDDDDLLDNFSELSLSVVSDAEVKPKGRRGERGSELLPLTPEEREELRRKKKWLQETLAERGIHIADETFTDPNEEPLLYELLQMTERLMRRKRLKDASAAGHGDGDGEEEDDVGIADFDAALLAKLFAKPKQYTLDELQQSALMEKLLRMGEELGADKMPLTSRQLDDVLAALLNPGGGRTVETTSMKLRRERLIREARQLREEMKRAEKARRREEHEAAEQQRREEEEAAAAAAAAAKKKAEEDETFALTGVPDLDGAGPRVGSAGSATTPADVVDPEEDPNRPFTGMTTSSLRVPSAPPLRPLSGGAGRPGSGRPLSGGSPLEKEEDYDTYFQLHPLTAAQRKEQERLYNEFEAYTTAEASEGGKYKVTFAAYTPEQFEAFYRHLHLGPQQRALLRGRAPLAPGTSLQGGTYHQLPTLNNNRNVGVRYGFSLGSAQVRKQYVWPGAGGGAGVDGSNSAEAFKPAPVKLFTLTTKGTLHEAIEENFSSYLDDCAYKDSLQRPQARPPSSTGSSLATSRQGLGRGEGGDGGVGSGGGGPPPPSASATLLPFSPNAASTTDSGAETERLPRIGIGFRRPPAPSTPPEQP